MAASIYATVLRGLYAMGGAPVHMSFVSQCVLDEMRTDGVIYRDTASFGWKLTALGVELVEEDNRRHSARVVAIAQKLELERQMAVACKTWRKCCSAWRKSALAEKHEYQVGKRHRVMTTPPGDTEDWREKYPAGLEPSIYYPRCLPIRVVEELPPPTRLSLQFTGIGHAMATDDYMRRSPRLVGFGSLSMGGRPRQYSGRNRN